MAYNTILVALCGRGDESKIIQEAVSLAEIHGAALKAVHVNDPHAGEMSMMMDNPESKFSEEDVRDWFRSAGVGEIAETVGVSILKSSSIQKAIIGATADVDLLILGHRRMNFFKENFFDSLDEGIVNHATCPVLVVPK